MTLIENLVIFFSVFVTSVCNRANGNSDLDSFDRHDILKNYIFNTRKKAKQTKQPAENPSSDDDDEETPSNNVEDREEVVLVENGAQEAG